MTKNDQIVYTYKGGVYINATNRCTNNCRFCLRNQRDGVENHDLWLSQEPSPEQIIAALKPYLPNEKITFCGFGEPMMRLDAIKAVSTFAKENGILVKVNTNGQASLVYQRDVLPELVGLVDVFSVSLNAPNAEKYQAECDSVFGEEAFEAVLAFAARSVELGFKTVLTVVDILSEEEINDCRAVAEKLGADFRVRHYV